MKKVNIYFKYKSENSNFSPSFDKDFLVAFYNNLQSEITRYRDREWATPGIFIAAIASIIGIIMAKENVTHVYAFDFLLLLLAFANSYYLFFVHSRLTKSRNIQKRLEYYWGLHEIQVNGYDLVDFSVKKPVDNDFDSGWMNGFWSHILPFSLLGMVMAWYGIWLLHS